MINPRRYPEYDLQELERRKFTVESDGQVNVSVSAINSLIRCKFDCILPSYPDDVTDVYVYKVGGISGVTVATLTVIWVDNTKQKFVSAVVS